MIRVLIVVAFTVVFACLTTAPVAAQRPDGRAVEFAFLAGATIFMPESGGSATVVGIPAGSSVFALAPSLNLTFWTESNIAIDVVTTYFRISGDGDDATLIVFEAGPSYMLGRGQETAMPFVGVSAGVVSMSGGGSETSLYLAARSGVRFRLKDHAASRMQVGFRHGLEDWVGSSLEIAGGVGFFL